MFNMMLPDVLEVRTIATLCYDRSQDLIPGSALMGGAFRLFSLAHYFFRSQNRHAQISTYGNTMLPGGILYVVAGHRQIVRKAAQVVLIIRTLFRCFEAIKDVRSSCQHFGSAMNHRETESDRMGSG